MKERYKGVLLYSNPRDPRAKLNVEEFKQFMDEDEKFASFLMNPNIEKAPWHLQVRTEAANGEKIIMDFWPTTLRGGFPECTAVRGLDDLRALRREFWKRYMAPPPAHSCTVLVDDEDRVP